MTFFKTYGIIADNEQQRDFLLAVLECIRAGGIIELKHNPSKRVYHSLEVVDNRDEGVVAC